MELTHTVVASLTQYGKTTTLEGIIFRSGVRAVAFKTKRGEAGFQNYHEIPAYFVAGSGWQYVESLVNSTLNEKVKYEVGMRNAIMQVSRGWRGDLRQLWDSSRKLAETERSGFKKDVFSRLSEYLELVVPEIERHSFSHEIVIQDGINVMDLTGMRKETQSLVIASVIHLASRDWSNVVIIIPEAWEHIPQGRNTPVKLVAADYIRKGASIGNYLFLDSQDIAGIDKEPLRQCDNWILGHQKDSREVKRTLEEIPKSKRPDAEEIMTLTRGVFYAVLRNDVHKVFVQPSWMDSETAVKVARGELSVDDIGKPVESDEVNREEAEKLRNDNRDLLIVNNEQTKLIEKIEAKNKELEGIKTRLETAENHNKYNDEKLKILSDVHENLKKRSDLGIRLVDLFREISGSQFSLSESKIGSLDVNLKTDGLVVNVEPSVRTVIIDAEKEWSGKVLQVMLEDFKDQVDGVAASAISQALTERGWIKSTGDLSMNVLPKMVDDGLLIKEGKTSNVRYRLPSRVEVKLGK